MRIFLLCCGPSIKYQNLQCLVEETCVTVSNFFVHPLIKEIDPLYHIFAPIHDPLTDEIALALYTEANEMLPDNTTVILDEKDIGRWDNFAHTRELLSYQAAQIKYQSVSQIALNITMAQCPTEIFLLGCDHNWIRHVGQTRHFYDSSDSVVERMGYDEWFGQEKQAAIIREKQCNDNLFRIYEQYHQQALANNMAIYNATPGSRLDVFPKTTLFNIFEEPTMELI